jgi:hypothetical protein
MWRLKMFPLRTKTFPANAIELERLLNESLREVFVTKGDPVRVVDEKYPALRKIESNLDGAVVRPNPPKPRLATGETLPALTAEILSFHGDAISIGPASVNLALEARDVRLNRGTDPDGEIVLGLDRAADGKVEISIAKANLEAAIAELAKREAAKHGVTVEDVRLTLRQLGSREVEAEASVRARKLFFATTIVLNAKLMVDDELNATVSGLKCSGEGAIGSMACGFLAPHLEKLEGRSFPLMALSLGEVRLRDARLSVGDTLNVSAAFSS